MTITHYKNRKSERPYKTRTYYPKSVINYIDKVVASYVKKGYKIAKDPRVLPGKYINPKDKDYIINYLSHGCIYLTTGSTLKDEFISIWLSTEKEYDELNPSYAFLNRYFNHKN